MSTESYNRVESFSLYEAILTIWDHKRFIFLFTIISLIISIIISLILPVKYTSYAVLREASDEDKSAISSVAGQFGALASLGGIDLGAGVESKADLGIQTLDSLELIRRVSQYQGFTEAILATKKYNRNTGSLSYKSRLYDAEKNMWKRNGVLDDEYTPSFQEVKRKLRRSFTASKDNRTNFVTVRFTHASPIFARDFVMAAVSEMNNIIRESDLALAEKAIDYLETELQDIPQLDLKQSTNQLLEAQLNKKMYATVMQDYVLQFIDPPIIPERKSSPWRSMIVIFGSLLGAFLGSFYILVRKFLN